MKKFLALLMLITVCLAGFTTVSFAAPVNLSLTVNGSAVTLSTHIEYSNSMYYISVSELEAFGFTYTENSSQYVLTRYNNELRVDKNSNTIYKNGVGSTFANAVVLPSKQNGTFYVSTQLVKDVFGGTVAVSGTTIALTLPNFASDPAKTVNGTVSLGSGKASKDISLAITAFSDADNFTTTVTLPSGSSSVSYSLPVYSTETNFTIKCVKDNSTTAYYSYAGTVGDRNDASSVGISGTFTANFTLADENTVSGTITGNGNGYLLVENEKGDVLASSAFYSSGSSTYSVTIPGNVTNAYIRYKIYNAENGVVSNGYFGADGITPFESETVAVDLSLDRVFDMNLLTGKTISGTITWNNGDVTSATVRAMTTDGKYITTNKTYTSAESSFAVTVPGDAYTEYVLVVNSDENGFAKYVSANGLTSRLSEAVKYNVSGGDVAGASVIIDNVAKASVIYGQLKLPEGLTATSDIPVTLYAGALTKKSDVSNGAYNVTKTYTASATILAGEKSVDYAISLDGYTGGNIALYYTAENTAVPVGYFDGYNSTVFSADKDISFNAEKTNHVDMYVVTNSSIDITAISDSNGNEFTASSTNKNSITVALANLTNINKTGKIFVGCYDNVNALIASGYSEYSLDGSADTNITVTLFGDTSAVKFLKIFTLDENGSLVARDIVIL